MLCAAPSVDAPTQGRARPFRWFFTKRIGPWRWNHCGIGSGGGKQGGTHGIFGFQGAHHRR